MRRFKLKSTQRELLEIVHRNVIELHERMNDMERPPLVLRLLGKMPKPATPAEEVEKLSSQRQQLVQKELTGTISAQERRTLALIQWQLVQIEDARLATDIEKLEARARAARALADQVAAFSQSSERGAEGFAPELLSSRFQARDAREAGRRAARRAQPRARRAREDDDEEDVA